MRSTSGMGQHTSQEFPSLHPTAQQIQSHFIACGPIACGPCSFAFRLLPFQQCRQLVRKRTFVPNFHSATVEGVIGARSKEKVWHGNENVKE
jgi:hypothetical protein